MDNPKDQARLPQGGVSVQRQLPAAFSQFEQQELERRLMEMMQPPPMMGGNPSLSDLGALLLPGAGYGPAR